MGEAERAIRALTAAGKTLVTAESCTGGLLGKLLTDVPGASAVYLGGVISYAYEVKTALLHVDPALLAARGAVCEEVARQMAEGVRQCLRGDFALATTGNAGPGTDEKNPNVGEIYIALASAEGTCCRRLQLGGGREENRLTTAEAALALLTAQLDRRGARSSGAFGAV